MAKFLILSQWAEIQLPVKPEPISSDVLFHGHVVERLVERDHRHFRGTERDECLDAAAILCLVFREARGIDLFIHPRIPV